MVVGWIDVVVFISPVAKTKLVFDITNESRMYGYIKLMLNDIFLFEWISCFMFYIQLLFSLCTNEKVATFSFECSHIFVWSWNRKMISKK